METCPQAIDLKNYIAAFPSQIEGNTSTPKPEVKDKLECLFEEQKRLIQKMDHARNKMQDIYKTPQIFDGYRIFMLSSAILHEIIELQRETNWKWW